MKARALKKEPLMICQGATTSNKLELGGTSVVRCAIILFAWIYRLI